MQHSTPWIININKKHGCAGECANRLHRVCKYSSSVDDGEQWTYIQLIKLSPVDVTMP